MNLIAIDLDGTLLSRNLSISNENLSAIKAAQQKGIDITIATGRSYFDAKSICESHNLHTHIISNNGAMIHLNSGERLEEIALKNQACFAVCQWLEENQFFYQIATEDNIYTNLKNQGVLWEEYDQFTVSHPELAEDFKHMMDLQFGQKNVKSFNTFHELKAMNIPIFGILALSFDLNRLKTASEKLKNFEDILVFSSFKYNLEFSNPNATKGYALQKLAQHLGFSLRQAMAIGDNHNDISMIEAANYGVAMGNAEDAVKAISDYVTLTNEDHGVAKAIQYFALSE